MNQRPQLSDFEHSSPMQHGSFVVNSRCKVGTEVGLNVSLDEGDSMLRGVIYRLLESDGQTPYQGPLMIDAEGAVRVCEDLQTHEEQLCSFIIEALSVDSTSKQSDVQSVLIAA